MSVMGADAKAPADAISIKLTVGALPEPKPSRRATAFACRTKATARDYGARADATGAMYGGLDVAEAIRTGTFDTLKDSDHTPQIKQRGIKFNLPLDVRTPTYTQREWPDSARLNVAEMWSKISGASSSMTWPAIATTSSRGGA